MKIIESNKTLDLSHDIYPGKITNVQTDKEGQIKELPVSSTFYGYVFKGTIQAGNLTASTGQYFCFTAIPESNSLDINVFKETSALQHIYFNYISIYNYIIYLFKMPKLY